MLKHSILVYHLTLSSLLEKVAKLVNIATTIQPNICLRVISKKKKKGNE